MPRLFLHIGTHKTGTTSIQRFCAANRDALRQHGLWYPPADVGKFPSHYAHHRISHAIADRDPEFDASDAKQFFRRVRRKMKSGESCLISAEPMYRHMLPDPYPDGGPFALDTDEANTRFDRYASAVRDCLGSFDVTVLVMLRRQDDFVESLFAEQVLATGYRPGIAKFADQRAPLLDYSARLSSWARAFGDENISVKVFDRSGAAKSIEATFLEWIGIEWSDDFTIGRRHNVTPSRALVEFKRKVNAPKQGGAVNTQIRRWIERLGTLSIDELPDLGRRYLSERDRAATMERYAASNREVAERFFGGETLFPDSDPSAAPNDDAVPVLSHTEFVTITQHLLRMLAKDAAKEQ